MAERFHMHHAHYLQRGRDGLTSYMQYMSSAVSQMNNADRAEAEELLDEMKNKYAPRVSALGKRAMDRFNDFRKRNGFPDVSSGKVEFDDELPHGSEVSAALPSRPFESNAFKMESPNTHSAKMLIELYGADEENNETIETVSEALDEFERDHRERVRTQTALATELSEKFSRGTFTTEDIAAFTASVQEQLQPSAEKWEKILGYAKRAKDQFGQGAQECQDIDAWLYHMTINRPDTLIMPTLAWNDEGTGQVVKIDGVIVHPLPDELPDYFDDDIRD